MGEHSRRESIDATNLLAGRMSAQIGQHLPIEVEKVFAFVIDEITPAPSRWQEAVDVRLVRDLIDELKSVEYLGEDIGQDIQKLTNIKRIIDRNCTSCHYPNSTVAGIVGDYTTYEGMKSHLDEGHVRERVVIDKDMPQSGGSMTQAERDSINCWILAGYPKN